MTLPTTRERVPDNTSSEVNWQIQAGIEERVRRALANPTRIDRRICELEEEWDIERAIEMNASALAFFGNRPRLPHAPFLAGTSRPRDSLPVPACAAGLVPAGSDPPPHGVQNVL